MSSDTGTVPHHPAHASEIIDNDIIEPSTSLYVVRNRSPALPMSQILRDLGRPLRQYADGRVALYFICKSKLSSVLGALFGVVPLGYAHVTDYCLYAAWGGRVLPDFLFCSLFPVQQTPSRIGHHHVK